MIREMTLTHTKQFRVGSCGLVDRLNAKIRHLETE